MAALTRVRTISEPAAPEPEGSPAPTAPVDRAEDDERPPVAPAAQPPAAPAAQRPAPGQVLDLNAPVTTLKGIGAAGERRLAPLGIATVRDLIYHFPRRYDDYGRLTRINQLELGQGGDHRRRGGAHKHLPDAQQTAGVSAVLRDSTGQIEAVWYNQPYQQQIRRRTLVLATASTSTWGACCQVARVGTAREELLHTGASCPSIPCRA